MKDNLQKRFNELSEVLLEERNDAGYWTGELSSSALGVAVAVAALYFHNPEEHKEQIQRGVNWLKLNINADGSYGDTPESPGNISTSLLVYAALNLFVDTDNSIIRTHERLTIYLQKSDIDLFSDGVADTILAHYKKDYTFSVPILTMCALCGIPEKNGFAKIPQLPFELSLFPQRFYRMLNLSVVSYAIPALIAVGIVIFKKKRSNKLFSWFRSGAEQKALRLLQKSMPESGGFLEAIPLTAFVSLSLINAGHANLSVVKKGIAFLKNTQRNDGGWPIDVDLSSWVTTLSVKALRSQQNSVLSEQNQDQILKHLKAIQNKSVHPFNGTSPGGWGWTNFSGSVPDGDDTPGAILALLKLGEPNEVYEEVLLASKWLLKLQNKDGGFPTFSKGWGKLPFDQSCADLTGHCLLALVMVCSSFENEIPQKQYLKMQVSIEKALTYLKKHQLGNGAWLPLWFGNQHTHNHNNPVYGTARVLSYLKDALPHIKSTEIEAEIINLIKPAEQFLMQAQNGDGSWGGDNGVVGSIEETSLAIGALQNCGCEKMLAKGFGWLDSYYQQNGLKAAPIGLYFASLWYHEKMYPLTTYLEALARTLEE